MLGDLEGIWSDTGLHCQDATDKGPKLSWNLTKTGLRDTTNLDEICKIIITCRVSYRIFCWGGGGGVHVCVNLTIKKCNL